VTIGRQKMNKEKERKKYKKHANLDKKIHFIANQKKKEGGGREGKEKDGRGK